MKIKLLILFSILSFLLTKSNCLVIKANYFYDNKNLYYINPITNPNGDLYFEICGSTSDARYINKINITSGKEIYFNDNTIKTISVGYVTTNHESIIVNIDGDNSDYIFTISYNKCEFINIEKGTITSKSTDKLIYKSDEKSSYRNNLIKLRDNNYVLTFQIEGTLSYYTYIHKFKFESNTIENYKKIKDKYLITNFVNSTCCFQVTKYIECMYCRKAQTNTLTIAMYDFDINEKNTQKIADAYGKAFLKMIHIRDELGAYVYFHYDSGIPKVQLRELIDTDPELKYYYNFTTIRLDGEGKYTISRDIFLSDIIKVNDTRIVAALTTNDLNGLLIYIIDANYDVCRHIYYYINLNTYGIQISSSLRAFIFRENFGIAFHNSMSGYPGYIIFNYPNITENAPKEITLRYFACHNS